MFVLAYNIFGVGEDSPPPTVTFHPTVKDAVDALTIAVSPSTLESDEDARVVVEEVDGQTKYYLYDTGEAHDEEEYLAAVAVITAVP